MLTSGRQLRFTPAELKRHRTIGLELDEVSSVDQFARALEVWVLVMAEVRPDIVLTLERKLNNYRNAAGGEAEAAPSLPITGGSSSAPPLHLIGGGRASLERDLMWAAALGRPTFDSLLRQLTPSANDAWCATPSSDESEPLHQSDAASDGCRNARPIR